MMLFYEINQESAPVNVLQLRNSEVLSMLRYMDLTILENIDIFLWKVLKVRW